jgi:hypothetical protein
LTAGGSAELELMKLSYTFCNASEYWRHIISNYRINYEKASLSVKLKLQSTLSFTLLAFNLFTVSRWSIEQANQLVPRGNECKKLFNDVFELF